MHPPIEISRAVSALRSVLRHDLEQCVAAADLRDEEQLRRQLSEMADKLKRVVNVLNGLR